MNKIFLLRIRSLLVIVLGVLMTSCFLSDPGENDTGAIHPAANPGEIEGIIDPSNHGWPRTVEGSNGQVQLQKKPLRVVTASIGHDEVTYSLIPFERVIGVGAISKDPIYSNVSDMVQNVTVISREPEVIIAEDPDVIVTSIYFDAKKIAVLNELGIPVIQTELKSDPEGQIQNILLMGYIYGEEARAEQLASEVRSRYDRLAELVPLGPDSERPMVLAIASFSNQFYGAGQGSTEGGIIAVAGGRNAGAIAGLEGNPAIGLESIISMMPEVILITQPEESGRAVRNDLMANTALSDVPAIKSGKVYIVEPKYFTTLSFWNILGAEKLFTILWPETPNTGFFRPFSKP